MYLPLFILLFYEVINALVASSILDYDRQFFIRYSSYFQILSILGFFFLVLEEVFDVQFTISGLYFVMSLFISSIFYMGFTFILIKRHKDSTKTSELDGASFYSPIRKQIEAYFLTSSDFLKPSFSFDDFVNDLNQPRHVVTEVLNKEMQKSFYKLLAEKRIEEAKRLLSDNNGALTIEALLYKCGFNSKSSFNKHFKDLVGMTPSEYQLTVLK